jgi:CRP/FNR family transcriptional regulator
LLLEATQPVSLPPGAPAFRAGSACEHYLLVISGSVRVQQLAESGREIVLYRVHGGETCVLTTACLLAHERYSAEAIAETAVEALALPQRVFDHLIGQSSVFRDFVFNAYASRLTELMVLVQEVAFGRIDARLAQRLLQRRNSDDRVTLTHYELAVELGTAREVISRQLKDFEHRGWVRLERGQIDILEPGALAARAAPASV